MKKGKRGLSRVLLDEEGVDVLGSSLCVGENQPSPICWKVILLFPFIFLLVA